MAAIKGRILALSWMMPPLVFPRSMQVARTLKTLKQFGWCTTVITALPAAEPLAHQDRRLADLYIGCYRQIVLDPCEDTLPSPWWLRAWRQLFPPQDIKADNWIRRASTELQKELKVEKYDALVTFAQPWVDHLIGLEVKRRHPSLPWVVHFSDPWVDSPYIKFTSDKQKKQAWKQERCIIEVADAVIFVNRHMADFVMEKYPVSWRSKVHVVLHGYDNDLLESLPENSSQKKVMRIVYTGSFYGPRNPALILSAIAELVKDPEARSRLRFEFLGSVDKQFPLLACSLGLDGVVAFSPSAGYLDSLSLASRADLLLLIDAPAGHSVFLPSKIADYIMLRKPILGVTPISGASADVLRKLGCAVVPPDDREAIVQALRMALERWVAGMGTASLPHPVDAVMFDIQQTTRDFERAIEMAIHGSDRPI